jgi:hypothetical protein
VAVLMKIGAFALLFYLLLQRYPRWYRESDGDTRGARDR